MGDRIFELMGIALGMFLVGGGITFFVTAHRRPWESATVMGIGWAIFLSAHLLLGE